MSSSSRRSTRAARVTRTTRRTIEQALLAESSKQGSSSLSSSNSKQRRLSLKPTRKWIKVQRPPAPGIGFLVHVWVPVDSLTDEERDIYLKARQEEAASTEVREQQSTTSPVPTSDSMDCTNNDNINSTPDATGGDVAMTVARPVVSAAASSTPGEGAVELENACAETRQPFDVAPPPPVDDVLELDSFNFSVPIIASELEVPVPVAQVEVEVALGPTTGERQAQSSLLSFESPNDHTMEQPRKRPRLEEPEVMRVSNTGCFDFDQHNPSDVAVVGGVCDESPPLVAAVVPNIHAEPTSAACAPNESIPLAENHKKRLRWEGDTSLVQPLEVGNDFELDQQQQLLNETCHHDDGTDNFPLAEPPAKRARLGEDQTLLFSEFLGDPVPLPVQHSVPGENIQEDNNDTSSITMTKPGQQYQES